MESAQTENWDIFVVDFDALEGDKANPVELLRVLAPVHAPLFIGSTTFAKWHDDLRRLGALILHKPTTIGEVGLALRRLIADAHKEKTG